MKPRRKLILIIVGAVVVLGAVVLVLPQLNEVPLAATIVGRATNAGGFPVVIVQLTNRSSKTYNFEFHSMLLSNTSWVLADQQHKDRGYAHGIQPASARTFQFPMPAEFASYRVVFRYFRATGRLEARLCGVFRRLRIPYPFDVRTQTFHVEVDK